MDNWVYYLRYKLFSLYKGKPEYTDDHQLLVGLYPDKFNVSTKWIYWFT